MDIHRFGFNLWKQFNRTMQVNFGGAPEVMTSAWARHLSLKGNKTGKALEKFINMLFRNPMHCESALSKEDDNLTKYASDPDGKALPILIGIWLARNVFVIGCVGYSIYSIVGG